jgi:uncharacterized protein YcnI
MTDYWAEQPPTSGGAERIPAMSRTGLRLVGGAAVIAATIMTTALPAFAHVTVNPNSATQGGFTKLTFRVPTESDNASTTKLAVTLPASQPLGFVSVKPHAGWSFTVTKGKLSEPITTDDGQVTEYVSSITWTADSAASAIKPGEFDEFDISAGPLPEADSMQFKAVQTYSDGTVVRWIEDTPASGEEPEHPAPTLKLTPAVAESAASTGTGAAAAKDTSKPAAAATSSSDTTASTTSVNLAIGLSIAALIVGLVAGALGALALRRKQQSPTPAPREMSNV